MRRSSQREWIFRVGEAQLNDIRSSWSPGTSKGQDPPSEKSNSDPLSTYVGAGTSQSAHERSRSAKVAEIENNLPGPQMPCFLMPLARNKEFFFRHNDLDMLDQAFFGSSPETPTDSLATEADIPKTFAICGPGGMGKTQLAAEFIYRRKDRFDAVFWIYADKAAKVAEGFGKIALELGLTTENSPDARDPVVIRELVKGWLVNPVTSFKDSDEGPSPLASWILIFDNADEPDELEDYWPLNGSGCVLFTSRDPYVKDSRLLATRGIDLEPFTVEEASSLLSRLTRKEGDSRGAAERLGGLPLAISQIASVIVRRNLNFNEFVKQYDEPESHLDIFEYQQAKGWRSGYEHNLASVWALESLKHGAVLLDTMSFLDPDGVHERILTTHPHRVALDDYPRTATVFFKARTELLQSSLIARDKREERLVVHRLIQDAARAKMTPERYREIFITAVTLVSSVWPYETFGWRHTVARWRVCEELFPHVLRLKQLAVQAHPKIGSSGDDLEFARLMNDAGW